MVIAFLMLSIITGQNILSSFKILLQLTMKISHSCRIQTSVQVWTMKYCDSVLMCSFFGTEWYHCSHYSLYCIKGVMSKKFLWNSDVLREKRV